MNVKRTRKLAAAAAASVMSLGAVAFGLQTIPAAQRAVAKLSPPTGDNNGAGAAPSGAAGTAASPTLASYKKDGVYSGKREYAFYGYVKVQAVISNGALTDVKVLEYPNDNGRSHYINSIALPYLIQEAVSAQNARVDFISGATFTSSAFTKSLQEALKSAGI